MFNISEQKSSGERTLSSDSIVGGVNRKTLHSKCCNDW